jgi:hypothetical protein
MKALLLGFFGVFAVTIGIVVLIAYPGIFWTLLVILIVVLIVGIRVGSKQANTQATDGPKRLNTAFERNGRISEDDIVHHHQPNGRPFDDRSGPSSILPAVAAGVAAAYILRPDEKPAAPVVEPDPEIESAAAMYYEGNDSYNEEEGEY